MVSSVDPWSIMKLAFLLAVSARIMFVVAVSIAWGVLNEMGERPNGPETISALANMFTQVLGPWALWIFGTGAFFIMFSTVLSAVGAGGRFIPDYLIEMGFFDRSNLAARRACIRVYVTVAPIIAFLIYMWVENPVLLVMIGGLISGPA